MMSGCILLHPIYSGVTRLPYYDITERKFKLLDMRTEYRV